MAISANHLTEGGSDVDANSFTTASISPTANALVLAAVAVGQTGAPGTPTLTGNSLTWVLEDSALYDLTGTYGTLFLFRAMGASPTSGTLSIAFGGVTHLACVWAVDEFTGVDTSGTNGSGAIVQSVSEVETDLGTTASVTLAAFADVANATYAAVAKQTAQDFTPGSGFTTLSDHYVSVPVVSVLAQWQAANDTVVDCSWATAGEKSGIIGVEIKAAQIPLVAAYSFDTGAIIDDTGNGHDGTMPGNDPTFSAGHTGLGMECDSASSQYASIPDHADFTFNTTNGWTVMCWVKLTTDATSMSLVTKQDQWWFGYDASADKFVTGYYLLGGGTSGSAVTAATFTAGSWIHVAMRYNPSATDVQLVINGAQDGTVNATTTMIDNSNPVMIGSWAGSSEFLDGIIDDVRIFNTYLTDAEITAFMSTPVGLALPVFDDFNRGSLGSDWVTAWTNSLPGTIVSNTYKASANENQGAYCAPAGNMYDGEAAFTISTMPGGSSQISLAFRANATGGGAPVGSYNAYGLGIHPTIGNWQLIRFEWSGFVVTELAVGSTGSAQAGDRFRTVFSGSNIKVYRTRSGSETLVADVNDGTYASGYVGFEFSDNVGSIDDFYADSIATFPTTPVLDNFTGSDETPIATNWTTPIVGGENSPRRSSNQFAPSAGGGYAGAWVDLAEYGPDCEAYVTIATLPASTELINLWARLKDMNGLPDGYVVGYVHGAPGTLRIQTITNDAGTILDSVSLTLSVGDKIGIRCIGDVIEAWVFQSGSWTRRLDYTDTDWTAAGRIGLQVNGTTTRLDDFGGGTYSPYAAEVLADSPAAYYRLNEATYPFFDLSGNANHSLDDSVTLAYQRPGLISTEPNDTAMGFNGTNTWIQIADDPTLDITGELTVEAWIRCDVVPANNDFAAILAKYTGTQTGDYEIEVVGIDATTAYIHLNVRGGGTSNQLNTETFAITEGQVYHVVATYKDSTDTMRIYVDGVLREERTDATVVLAGATSDLNIGGRVSGTGFANELFFNGVIDEVAIYPTQLSPARVAAHYVAGVGGYVAEVMADAPAAYYRMNETSGQPKDLSGNVNNTTTVSGTPTYGHSTPIPGGAGIYLQDDYFTAPDHSSLDLGDVWTLECWVKPARYCNPSESFGLISKMGNGSYYVRLEYSTATTYALDSLAVNTANLVYANTTDLQAGEWHHIVATKNGSTRLIYIDGQDVSVGGGSNFTTTNNNDPFYIGGMNDVTPAEIADAIFSEVAVYPTALSAARILAHFNAASAYAMEVLADEPVVYYRMHELSGQLHDSSGNAIDTTVVNGTPNYTQTGAITTDSVNDAILFDSTATEYFSAPHNAVLDVGDSFTLEAWVKRGTLASSEYTIIAKGRDGTGSGPGLYIYSDDCIMIGYVGIVGIAFSSATISDTDWHHVVGTKNGSTMKIYLDGVDVSDPGSDNNQTIDDSTQVLTIGAENSFGSIGSQFDGIIDEVAMYDTALSRERIIAHYLAAGESLRNTFETGLADETAITTANSNEGTAGGQWDNLVVTAGGTAVYDTDRAAYGTLSGRFTPITSGGAHVRWDEESIGLTRTEIYGRYYIYRTANPTPNPQWMTHLGVVGTDHVGVIRWKADGKLEILNNPFSTVGTSTNSIPLNEWVRVEYHVVCHPTTGTLEVKFFHGHGTTPIETVTASNTNTSTAVNEINFGQWNAETTGSSFWLDEIALSITEYIGPATEEVVVEKQTFYVYRRRSYR